VFSARFCVVPITTISTDNTFESAGRENFPALERQRSFADEKQRDTHRPSCDRTVRNPSIRDQIRTCRLCHQPGLPTSCGSARQRSLTRIGQDRRALFP